MACSRSATARTSSAGTYRKTGSLSTNFRISHGHAIRSTFAFLRVTHFIVVLLRGMPRAVARVAEGGSTDGGVCWRVSVTRIATLATYVKRCQGGHGPVL